MKQPKQLSQDFSGPSKLLPKFLLLTLLKEGYLLLVNSYGFIVHPYLTLRRVDKDRSQLAIFGSLWLGAWLGIVFFVGLTALLIPHFFPRFFWIKKIGLGLGAMGVLFMAFFTFYLLYWLKSYLRGKR